jgi:acyl carrier protein
MEPKLLDRVRRIISQVMKVPIKQINTHSSPDNIENWDSISHMNLVLALEEEFKVSFSDEEIVELLNVEIILETLRGK